jgi:hypothetical protein
MTSSVPHQRFKQSTEKYTTSFRQSELGGVGVLQSSVFSVLFSKGNQEKENGRTDPNCEGQDQLFDQEAKYV